MDNSLSSQFSRPQRRPPCGRNFIDEIYCRVVCVWCALLPVFAVLILLAVSSPAQFAFVADGGGSNNVWTFRIGEDGAFVQRGIPIFQWNWSEFDRV